MCRNAIDKYGFGDIILFIALHFRRHHTDKSSKTGTVRELLKKNAVAVIALFAAIITAFFVRPDAGYIDYFDFKTLSCLFCVLAVVGALKEIRFFYVLAHSVVRRFGNMRLCALALVYITFIGSMLIANDMALLTFLPLGYIVLSETGESKYMAPLFILQNIAANLGGMLTPFGNPQNLFLYSKFNIRNLEFIEIMAPSFLLSILLFTVCCMIFFRAEKLSVPTETAELPRGRTAFYLLLFALSIVMVFRIIPYYIGLAVVFVSLFITDRKALAKVDYPLLLTFVFFFVFAGNMGRIEPVREFLGGLLEKNTLLVSTLSCQAISNVPSAILLSQFTENYRPLLVGVNIGGTGTIIASLASLITFREYTKHNKGKALSYLLVFSAFNFSFLIILFLFNQLFFF